MPCIEIKLKKRARFLYTYDIYTESPKQPSYTQKQKEDPKMKICSFSFISPFFVLVTEHSQ